MHSQRKKIVATVSLLALTSCATNEPELSCALEEPLPVMFIERDQVANYWTPTKTSQSINLPAAIEKSLASGRLAGFVVAEQTIGSSGNIENRKIVGFYPNKRILQVDAFAQEHASRFNSVTCPVQPVRYRSVDTYGNGEKSFKRLMKVYDEYEKNL